MRHIIIHQDEVTKGTVFEIQSPAGISYTMVAIKDFNKSEVADSFRNLLRNCNRTFGSLEDFADFLIHNGLAVHAPTQFNWEVPNTLESK